MTNAPSPSWLRQCGPRLAALWPWKLGGLTGGMTVFFAAYFWVLHHPVRPPVMIPLTAVDAWVAFTPAALPLYLSLWVYLSLAPALMTDPDRLLAWFFAAFKLGAGGLVLFYVFPTVVPSFAETWAPDSAFAFLKQADAAGNAFPSLHVGFAVFTAFALARQLRELGAGPFAHLLNVLWSAGIVWSTLATRQHVFIDAVAGAFIGAIPGAKFLLRSRVSPTARPPE